VKISRHPRRGALLGNRRGSWLIEGALAMLPLLALLFGVLDVAFAIFARNTMQFAVHQGVRYAVTSQTMTNKGQDASIKTVVDQDAVGLLEAMTPAGQALNQISINYYNPVTLALVTGPGSNIGGNIVVVSATGLSWAWMAPLLRDATPLHYSVSSADIMEATPLAGAPAR
jgi:Flp pilus assembly protein TadG